MGNSIFYTPAGHHKKNPFTAMKQLSNRAMKMLFFRKRLAKKHRLYFDLFVGALIVVLIPCLIYLMPKTADASWFDDNWSYRKAIAITDSAAETNKYATLSSYDASDSTRYQADCGDVRFTDQNGKLLVYTVSSCGASTTFHINMPTINLSQTIFMYYGNPGAANGFKAADPYSACSTCSTGSPASEEPGPGPTGYWKFDEGYGSSAKDSTTTGKNGTTQSGAGSIDTITYDNATGGACDPCTANTLTYSHTVNSNTNGILVVSVAMAGGGTVSSMTYAGNSMTFIARAQLASQVTVELWRILTPSTGANNVVIVDSGGSMAASAVSYTNVNQTTPTGTAVTGTNTTGNPSVSVTSSSGDLQIDGVGHNNGNTWTVAAGQTQRVNQSAGAVARVASSERAGGDATAMTWTHTSGNWAQVGVALKQSSSATLVTTMWQTDDQCIFGKCLLFNGSTTNVGVSGTISGVKSVSFWAKPASSSASLIKLATGVDIKATSGVVGTDGITSPTTYVNGVPNGTITANQWNHIEVTTGSGITASSISLGSMQTGVFSGLMDEVKFYPYTRTADQVKTDYNSRGASKGAGVALGANAQNNPGALSNGLIAYWKMDQASWNGTSNEVVDSSGTTNHGTSVNGATTTAGMFDRGGSFDGSNDYVSATVTQGRTTTLTVAGWIKPTSSVSARQDLVASGNSSAFSTNNWILSIKGNGGANGAIEVLGYDAGNATTILDTPGSLVSVGVWAHVAFTSDGTTVRIYVNGVLRATGVLPIGTASTTGEFIGKSSAGSLLTGAMDETRIYNRALSDGDVFNLYNFAPGPAGYWNFDEKSGTAVNDTSGNNNTGTLTNGPLWTSGKYSGGISFNGSNQYITAAHSSTITPTGDYTVSAWINTSSTNVEQAVATKFSPGGAYPGFLLSVGDSTSTGKTCFWVGGSAWKCGATSVNDGKWHYITGSVSGTTISVYYDGVLDGTGTQTPSRVNTSALEIGRRSDTGVYFPGKIDDVKIYTYARTQKQIVEDMNANHPAPGSPVGSPVGWWKFDEGADNTCSGGSNDACNSGNAGSTLDGANTNMASPATLVSGWSNAGKFGRALSFDGSNDYVEIASSTTMSSTDSTWCVWFNTMGGFGAGTGQSGGMLMARFDSGGSGNGSGFQISPSGTIDFFNGGGGNWSISTSGKDYRDGTWHHACAINASSGTVSIYADGMLKATGTVGSGWSFGANPLRLGISTDTFWGKYKGFIDEPKIYNGALTIDQIRMEMNRGSAQVLGALSNTSGLTGGTTASNSASAEYCVTGDTTSCAAPVGEWKMDEKKGTTAFDTSGSGNNGTLAGNANWTPGKIGAAINLDGTGDWVNVGAVSAANIAANNFSLCTWFKTSGTEEDMISNGIGTNGNYLMMSFSGRIRAHIWYSGNSNVLDGNITVNDNKWHYGCQIVDATKLYIYVDGILDISATLAGSKAGTTGSLVLGNRDTSSGSNNFGGQMDMIRIYNYARTPSQIAWDYNQGKPVGWWKLDECTGGSVNDSMGKFSAGTITIGTGGGTGHQDTVGNCGTSAATAWYNGRNGKYNSSLNFDGIDDYASLNANATNLGIGNATRPFTISAWLKTTGSGEYYIVDNTSGGGSVNLISLRIDTGKVETLIADSSNTNGAPQYGSGFNDGNWHNFILTWDGAGTEVVYVDSRQIGTKTSASVTGSVESGTSFLIAQRPAAVAYFPGQLDDIRIYGYALNATQVKNVYNQNAAIQYAPVTGTP